MDEIASQITSLTIVYSIVYSDADQRKHQSSVSPAFVRGIHRGPVNSPHKWPVTRKMFPFDDVIMLWFILCSTGSQCSSFNTSAICHISPARTQCEWHYSGSVLTETLSAHWCHITSSCNNPNGMSVQNLSFFRLGFVKVLSNFNDGIQLRFNIFLANFVHMIIEITGGINKTPRFPGGPIFGAHIWVSHQY